MGLDYSSQVISSIYLMKRTHNQLLHSDEVEFYRQRLPYILGASAHNRGAHHHPFAAVFDRLRGVETTPPCILISKC